MRHCLYKKAIMKVARLFNPVHHGGWQGFRFFRIIRKEKESCNITSFYLIAVDSATLPDFRPGQYITVRVKMPNNSTTMRHYSMSDKSGQNHFRISVKREVSPDGKVPPGYVSNMLHDKIEVGNTIEITPPCGAFFLNISAKHVRPLVLLAAGVGITPINSILLSVRLLLVHAVLNEDVQTMSARDLLQRNILNQYCQCAIRITTSAARNHEWLRFITL